MRGKIADPGRVMLVQMIEHFFVVHQLAVDGDAFGTIDVVDGRQRIAHAEAHAQDIRHDDPHTDAPLWQNRSPFRSITHALASRVA